MPERLPVLGERLAIGRHGQSLEALRRSRRVFRGDVPVEASRDRDVLVAQPPTHREQVDTIQQQEGGAREASRQVARWSRIELRRSSRTVSISHFALVFHRPSTAPVGS